MYALDFDQDGDVDVLSSSTYDHEITLYENNGSQTFTAFVIGTGVSGTRSVYAGDMDNDGDNDIVAVGGMENMSNNPHYFHHYNIFVWLPLFYYMVLFVVLIFDMLEFWIRFCILF